MVGMLIKLGKDFEGQSNCHECVRPIGMWRFLTPLEVPQAGDLFRIIAGTVDRKLSPYMNNWTVEENTGDQPMSELPEYEYMRAVDNSSGYVPVFERKQEYG